MNILMQRRGALGDVLNTTPVLRRLRKENPEARIDVVTRHIEAFRSNPYLTSLCPDPPVKEFHRIVNLDMASERMRRTNQIDAMMMAAFGDTEGDKTIYLNHDMEPPRAMGRMPWERTVVIHPNMSWDSRTLSQEWWQKTADMLVAKGFLVVSTGTRIDKAVSGKGIMDMRDKFSLSEQASLIENSAAALCGLSGVASLTGATETPLIVTLTITRAEYTLPYRHGILGWNCTPVRTPMECYGCQETEPPLEYYACKRGDNACVHSFDNGMVVEAVVKAIENDQRKTVS